MARIKHLAILTEDVEKLVKFYTSAFGLKIVSGIGIATYLSDGHINLAIIPIEPERKIEGAQLKPGLYHFGFEVDDVAGLREACKELNARLASTKDRQTARPNTGFMILMAIRSISPNMAGRFDAIRANASGYLKLSPRFQFDINLMAKIPYAP